MNQNVRRGWRKFLIGAVIISAVVTLIGKDVLVADYIPDPVLVDTIDKNPPVTKEVIVTLTASPTEGPTPLKVAFTCTATAEIHYADEIWAQPPQGSVEETKPLYKTVPAKITKEPADQILKKIKTHTFTATAEHGGNDWGGFCYCGCKKTNLCGLICKESGFGKRVKESL